MANTFSAALVVDSLRLQTQTILQTKLASLDLFSTDFSVDPMAPLRPVRVPFATVGGTAQTNATNFESGDSTLAGILVTPAQISVSFNITNSQLQQGFRMEQLFKVNMGNLARAIMDAATVPFTTTNFGAAAVTATAVNFGLDDLQVLLGAGKDFDSTNLILDGSYLAQFLPADKLSFALGEEGAYGFDRIAKNNRWTGAGANVVGALMDPKAVGLASGLAIIDDAVANMMIMRETVMVEGINLPVQFCMWGSLASRSVWASFDVMFGAGLGDATAGKLIKSA